MTETAISCAVIAGDFFQVLHKVSESTTFMPAPGLVKSFSLSMFQRRALFCTLVLMTMAALLWMTAVALSPGGFGFFDLLFLLFFAVTLPWTVIGFWNAVIGFIIMRFARDPLGAVNPSAASIKGDEPVTASTALLL